MSNLNNPVGLNKVRQGTKVSESYLSQVETIFRQLFQNLGNGVRLPTYTVSTLPNPTEYETYMVYCSDETGGAVPVFSDGTNWRRVTDRAIAS